MYISFYDLVFSGVPLARKAVIAFIIANMNALWSMKQGYASCMTEATLFGIGVSVWLTNCHDVVKLLF